MGGKETPDPIWINFYRMPNISDLITYEEFGDDRLTSFGVAGSVITIPH